MMSDSVRAIRAIPYMIQNGGDTRLFIYASFCRSGFPTSKFTNFYRQKTDKSHNAETWPTKTCMKLSSLTSSSSSSSSWNKYLPSTFIVFSPFFDIYGTSLMMFLPWSPNPGLTIPGSIGEDHLVFSNNGWSNLEMDVIEWNWNDYL